MKANIKSVILGTDGPSGLLIVADGDYYRFKSGKVTRVRDAGSLITVGAEDGTVSKLLGKHTLDTIKELIELKINPPKEEKGIPVIKEGVLSKAKAGEIKKETAVKEEPEDTRARVKEWLEDKKNSARNTEEEKVTEEETVEEETAVETEEIVEDEDEGIPVPEPVKGIASFYRGN